MSNPEHIPEPTHPHAHAKHHHGSAALYVRTLVALLILTAITVAASYIDFGAGNVVIALFIATIKATIVALFFMHLRWDKPVNAVIACAGFLFLGIFLMFDFIDFGSRDGLRPVNWDGKLPIETVAPATPGAAPAAAEKK
jgi:cytochrome c oxidase subunit IV